MHGRKKHRGLRRYYRKLATSIDFGQFSWERDGIEPVDGSNPMHWHFDRKGYGNASFKRRKPHLDKLFRHFDCLADKMQKNKTDFQLFAIVLDYSSSNDALFLHQPNPNKSQFPFVLSDLQLTTTLTNHQLNEYINNLDGYEKRYGQANEAFCFLFKKNRNDLFDSTVGL